MISGREKESVSLNYIPFSVIGSFNLIIKGDKSERHSKRVRNEAGVIWATWFEIRSSGRIPRALFLGFT